MRFKDFLNESDIQTFTFNRSNWSGKTDTLTIDNKKGTFKSDVYKGKFKNKGKDKVEVYFDGYKEPFTVFKDKNTWTAADWDDEDTIYIDSNEHAVVAAVKLAHNIM